MKQLIKQLADNLMIELSDAEVELMAQELEGLKPILAPLKQLDTQGIKPRRYPFTDQVSELVLDEVKEQYPVEELLANTKNKQADLVVVSQVVK